MIIDTTIVDGVVTPLCSPTMRPGRPGRPLVVGISSFPQPGPAPAGVDRTLAKPVHPLEVLRTVEDLLASRPWCDMREVSHG